MTPQTALLPQHRGDRSGGRVPQPGGPPPPAAAAASTPAAAPPSAPSPTAPMQRVEPHTIEAFLAGAASTAPSRLGGPLGMPPACTTSAACRQEAHIRPGTTGGLETGLPPVLFQGQGGRPTSSGRAETGEGLSPAARAPCSIRGATYTGGHCPACGWFRVLEVP